MQSHRVSGDVEASRQRDTLRLRVTQAGAGVAGVGDLFVLQDYDGPALPRRLPGAILELDAPWEVCGRILAGGQEFALKARTLSAFRHEPGLFQPLHAPFALGRRERLVGGLLLKVMRWPIGPRLLRAWHARRR